MSRRPGYGSAARFGWNAEHAAREHMRGWGRKRLTVVYPADYGGQRCAQRGAGFETAEMVALVLRCIAQAVHRCLLVAFL